MNNKYMFIIKHLFILIVSIFLGFLLFIITLPYTVNKIIDKDFIFSEKITKNISNIYSSDNTSIATVLPSESFIPYNENLSNKQEEILFYFEDKNFYNHDGIDYKAIIRAAIVNFKEGKIKEGGSTITQQLVKNEFLTNKRSFERKFFEAIYALSIESKYDKKYILNKYINTIFFGGNIYGMQTASINWFGKSIKDLKFDEFLVIVNTIPSPNNYNPYSNLENSKKRYYQALELLHNDKLISNIEYNKYKASDPFAKLLPKNNDSKIVIHYPWVYSTIISELKKLYPNIDIKNGNIDIYTDIKIDLQDNLEKVINNELKNPKSPNGSSVIIDSKTMNIIAISGGKDFTQSEVNTALGIFGGGTGRQPGSLFKFITLVTALNKGYKLTDYINAPKSVSIKGRDPVYNYDNRSYGKITLKNAFANSINTAFVNLAIEIGPEEIQKQAQLLGIDAQKRGGDITLGIDEVSPLQMVSMLATINNEGIFTEPKIITKIINNNNNIPLANVRKNPAYKKEIIPDLKLALREVIRNGTGGNSQIGNLPILGKTGTTDKYTNAWFIGLYDNIVSSTWVGYNQGQIPMININGFNNVSGGSIPAIIFKKSLDKFLKNTYPKQYKIPINIPFIKLEEDNSLEDSSNFSQDSNNNLDRNIDESLNNNNEVSSTNEKDIYEESKDNSLELDSINNESKNSISDEQITS